MNLEAMVFNNQTENGAHVQGLLINIREILAGSIAKAIFKRTLEDIQEGRASDTAD